MKKIWGLILVLLSSILNQALAANAFDSNNLFNQSTQIASPAEVFKVNTAINAESKVVINFDIMTNYYIYRDRLKVNLANLDTSKLIIPHGIIIQVPETSPDGKLTFESEEVLSGQFSITLPTIRENNAQLEVVLQGCDGKSICYPPQKYNFILNEHANTQVNNSLVKLNSVQAFKQLYNGSGDGISLLNNLNLFELVVIFLVAGFIIALTPCMYPLYPIALTSILAGYQGHVPVVGNSLTANSQQKSLFSTLKIVLIYLHGIALIYVVMGVIAALSGQLLTTLLQQPYFILTGAVILLILGLSMLGLFEIKLSNRLQSYFHNKSAKLNGGTYGATFLMGIFSSLLLGPCITPPLIVAIGFIAQKASVIVGILGLYAMALGMGLPILILALAGNKLLPKSGSWMEIIKKLMGVLIIAVALYLAYPFLAHSSITTNTSSIATEKVDPDGFIVVETTAQLNNLINSTTKPVVIDFYADWCAVCKEMAVKTFPNPDLQRRLNGYTKIRIDITANTADQAQLLKQYNLYGPPAIIILNQQHQLQDKLLGFIPAEEFIKHLQI